MPVAMLLLLFSGIEAAPGYSFDGVVMNISKLIKRENVNWFVLAWDAKTERMTKYPFHEDDENILEPYCIFKKEVMSDIQADKYPTGHVLDYFGVPSAYSRTPIRALKDRTVKLGIIVRNQRVRYSSQNMCVLDAWNSTLVTWRLRDQRRLDKTQFVWVNRDELDEHGNWRRTTPIDWFEYRDSKGNHFPHIGEDMRLMKLQSDPSRIFANWCLNREENGLKFVTFHFAEIHYPGLKADGRLVPVQSNTESLYVKWPGHKVNMYHEVTPRSEKNWPMFEYVNASWQADTAYRPAAFLKDTQYEGMSERDQTFWRNHNKVGHGDTGGGNLLFVHSIQPFRVVAPSVLPHHRHDYNITGGTSAQSVSLSVITNYCWVWGKLRGGTPPQLVDLPPGYISYGGLYKGSDQPPPDPQPQKEYLAFFHGVVHMAQHLVMTYTLGVYTFTAEPPFRITAMSEWPIVSPDWMDSFTYKHTDIVVFPMTYEHDDRHINVTYGWDESDGYVLTLDKKILFESLRPTNTHKLGSVDLESWARDHRPDASTFEYGVDWYRDCEKVLGEANCASFRKRQRVRRRRLREEAGTEAERAWGVSDDVWLDQALQQKFGGGEQERRS